MRIVVIGYGMVGSRFIDNVSRHRAVTGADVTITVLSQEPYEPYNRLMLSEVIAQRADIANLTLPCGAGEADVRCGVWAVSLDRTRRVVTDSEGDEHPYDLVVFATGARPRIPPITGLGRSLGAGVQAVRTMDDCRQLLAACQPGRRMVVLGGGLLGVEIACGLRSRGVQVCLVHSGSHLMERQLDGPTSRMAATTLADLGVDVCLSSQVNRVIREDGTLVGVELADGTLLPADVLVVNTGVQPRTEVAAAAGLATYIGIVVDDQLRSVTDDRVAAIGDCAQTEAGCPGLIAPGWDQAEQLAREVTGLPPVATPTVDADVSVIKLKAKGLEVVTLGPRVPDPFEAHNLGLRVVSLSDVSARRSVTVTVNGDRIVSAAIVGSPRTAAQLTTAYERRTPLPTDPAHLLLTGAAAAVPEMTDPTTLPNKATVCRCNGVTKKDIVDAHLAGHCSVEDVATATRATTGCGGCRSQVCGILEWMDAATTPAPAPESTGTSTPAIASAAV